MSEASITADAVLSTGCEQLLAAREWYATPEPGFGSARIWNAEGTRLFDVDPDVDAFTLAQLLRYAEMQYRRGKLDGERELQAKARALFGAAAEPEEE